MISTNSVKDSQFKKPLLEFSAPAQAAPDFLCPPDYPGLRRPYVYLQRNRLLFYLGRPGCYQPVHR